MRKLRKTSRAELDLLDIYLHQLAYGMDAAERALETIEKRCRILERHPYGGEACPPGYGAGLRWLPAGNWVIFYSVQPDAVSIVRVLDGRRDLPRVFGKNRLKRWRLRGYGVLTRSTARH